jgi:KDO2-lipid IV(A) lauroyltransferase
VVTRLFGRDFEVPEGPFRLARLAGAPLIPLFAVREGYFDYTIEVEPAIALGPSASSEALGEAAQSAARALERFVRAHPTQWFHFASP